MTATQTQLRRGTSAQCNAMTPAVGEAVIDTSNNRIRIGDGTTAGGISLPNASDTQKNSFNYLTAGGSANALTATPSPAIAAYTAGIGIFIKAAATNSGAATLNLNGLGAKNIKKVSSGTLAALSGGEIVSGGIYYLIYDGVQFQLQNGSNSGLSSVSQGNLNTSAGSVSTSSSGSFTLPGGEYGFFPQTRYSSFNLPNAEVYIANGVAWASYTTGIYLLRGAATGGSIQAQQRYVTSSPPFDLGDGEAGGFIFALVDKAGEVVSSYAADVPPWAYNGPTNIRADHICPVTRKKFRRIAQKMTPEQIMDGAALEYRLEEITHKIKNADMALIPHPFLTVPQGLKPVMLDPMSDKVRRLINLQNAGDGQTVQDMLHGGYIKIGSEAIRRKGPRGVHVSSFSFRSTRHG